MNKLITATLIFLLSSSPLLAVTGGGEVLLDDYWKRPLPTNSEVFNKLTTGKSEVSASTPSRCGKCHKDQFDDWRGALHSKATGPGLSGQLKVVANPQDSESCYFCHAPSDEQNEMIKNNESKGYSYNLNFSAQLKKSGVSCFVCHMRNGNIYGPSPSGKLKIENQLNKNSSSGHTFVKENFFEDAHFCAACHQLKNGYALNGKILVNTYNEWKESTYGQANIVCQNCHMPERRHLFRGIHDPETTRKGLTFNIDTAKENGVLKAKLTITNSGVGHYFPTYVTPLVVVRGVLKNGTGEEIKGSLKEKFIGRMVTLDLSRELYDTRILPGGSFEFSYDADEELLRMNKMIIEVRVYPDMFYNGFYHSLIRSGNYSDKNAIEKAIKATEESVYILYEKEILPSS